MDTSVPDSLGSSPSPQPPIAPWGPLFDGDVAIALRNIDMVFCSRSQPFQALKSVNLSVVTGGVHFIVGPAGSGKTTLLLIAAGLLTPTGGQVELMGIPITALSRQEAAHFRLQTMGIVFQENNLLRSLTALENVEVTLHLRGIRGQAAHQQAQQLLEALQLGDKAHQLPRQLSGGQQQRVAVARALAGDPQLLIADEPTAALDSKNGRIVAELFHQRTRATGCTVLMATHDLRIIQFADQVTYLEDGEIITAPEPST